MKRPPFPCATFCFLLVCGGMPLRGADDAPSPATPTTATTPGPGEILKVVQPALDELGGKPDGHGAYAIDGGRLVRLSSYGRNTAPNAEDLKREFVLSTKPSFIVYEDWLAKYKSDATSTYGLEWRYIDVKPRPKFPFVIQAVPDHPDMIMLTPQETLKPGLYSLQAGNLQTGLSSMADGEFRFGVETPDEEAYWQDVVKNQPDSWHAHSHLGAAFYSRRDYDGALEQWKRSVELAPQIYETHNNYALALNAKGQVDDALEQYKQAVAAGGTWQVRINYAAALQAAKHYDEAISQYDAVQKLSPGNFDALSGQGICYSGEGAWDVAVRCFQMALKIKPDDTDVKQRLQNAQQKMKAAALSVDQAWEGK